MSYIQISNLLDFFQRMFAQFRIALWMVDRKTLVTASFEDHIACF